MKKVPWFLKRSENWILVVTYLAGWKPIAVVRLLDWRARVRGER